MSIVSVVGPHFVHAQVAPADPIDTAMQNCLARADRSSPAGQIQCINAAQVAWSDAMNIASRSIAAHAPPKLRWAWQESQRCWVAWRKEEAPLMHAVFDAARDASAAMTEANVLLQAQRDHALELRRAAARFAHPPSQSKSLQVEYASSCSRDIACAHAQADLSRYYIKLREKLPGHSRALLVRAQRNWMAYRNAMTPLTSGDERVDLIGARIATLKRYSEATRSD